MDTTTAESALKKSIETLDNYNKTGWQSLKPCSVRTADGRKVFHLELKDSFGSYLINNLKWFFMRQKYHKNLQTLASANHPSLSDRLVQHANEGKIPYIKQGRLYAKIDPNTPDRFPNTINIGVVGDGGTGKGSLINALRRLRARDTGAAEVGVTGSNQVDTNRYPLTSTHCLCELPAFNAMYGPTAAFAERTKLSKYDAIIVTLSDSPTKNTLKLVKMANDSDIPVYFVRTKADEDIRNQREDYRRKADQVIRDINEDMSRALERENLSVQSKHFVSSRTGYQGEVKPALDALIAALNIQTKRN